MDDQNLEAKRKSKSNRIAVIFVLKMFALYFLLSEANKFMYSATTPSGRFYNSFLASHFDYIQGLRSALIIPSTWIIKAFGFTTYYNATEIMITDGPILSINYDCLGLGVISFLIAFAVAFPIRWKSKLKLLAALILIVYVLNVFRIAGLGILLRVFPSQQRYFEYHHEVFSITIYIVIFVVLYFWIKRNSLLIKIKR